jgi:hypothetical protein
MTDAQVEQARKLSAQTTPDDYYLGSVIGFSGGYATYANSLPSIYDDRRQKILHYVGLHPQNGLWPGALARLSHKIAGTSAEISGKRRVKFYQDLLMFDANKGRGFASFVSEVLTAWSTYDDGAVVELIGRGDPSKPLKKEAIVGIAVLDTLRCYFSADAEYPVWYEDAFTGKLHRIHHTRVYRFVDQPFTDPELCGRGLSAMSRGISWLQQAITQQTFVGQSLDDQPPPGLLIINGMPAADFDKAWALYKDDLAMPDGKGYKNIVRLTNMEGEAITVEFVRFSTLPSDSYDFERIMYMLAKGLALALDVDFQDILPLESSTFGTAGEAKILEKKNRNGGFTYILSMFERFFNDRVLPDALTFRWKYRDAEESAEQVAGAKAHVEVMNAFVDLMNKTGVTDTERLNEIVISYLARNVPGLEELLYEGDGQVIRLYTDDPQPDTEGDTGLEVADNDEVNTEQDIGDAGEQVVLDDAKAYVLLGSKDFNAIAEKFIERLGGTLIAASQGRLRNRRLGSYVRSYLASDGLEALMEGKKVGGVDEDSLTPEEDAAFTAWLAEQNTFIADLEKRVRRGVSTGEDGPRRPLTDTELWSTARAWANVGLQKAYYIGVQSADKNGMYEFVGDDGAESCRTCKRLKGQIHRMSDWSKAKLIPGIDVKNYECGGYQCQHRLRKVKGRARGRLKMYGPTAPLSLLEAFDSHFWPGLPGERHTHAVHNHS